MRLSSLCVIKCCGQWPQNIVSHKAPITSISLQMSNITVATAGHYNWVYDGKHKSQDILVIILSEDARPRQATTHSTIPALNSNS